MFKMNSMKKACLIFPITLFLISCGGHSNVNKLNADTLDAARIKEINKRVVTPQQAMQIFDSVLKNDSLTKK